jgi:hypothetical protein
MQCLARDQPGRQPPKEIEMMNPFKRWNRQTRIRVTAPGLPVLVSDVLDTSPRLSDISHGKPFAMHHTLDDTGDFMVLLTRSQARRLFALSAGVDLEARYRPTIEAVHAALTPSR